MANIKIRFGGNTDYHGVERGASNVGHYFEQTTSERQIVRGYPCRRATFFINSNNMNSGNCIATKATDNASGVLAGPINRDSMT